MVIVDKEIKELVNSKSLIVNFNEKNLSSISYDIVIDNFVVDGEILNEERFVLSPSDFIYIKAKESLNMPFNLCCKVIEKNSLMRMGLKVDGPLYQPGHKTNIYVRVLNISKKEIKLTTDMKIAQLVFLKLNEIPMTTYDKQIDSHYNNEDCFRG